MAIHSSNFTELTDLNPVLAEIFHEHLELVDDQTSLVYGMRTSSKGQETDFRIGSFKDPVPFNETGQIQYQEVNKGYTITYTPVKFADGFQVDLDLIDDNQYESIFTMASELGRSFRRKRQKDAFSVFNNAFTAGSTAGYDGVALCSASHPIIKGSSTTVSNTGTLALNSTNLEAAIVAHMSLGDDNGEEVSIMPSILLTGRAQRKVSLELTGSELTPESANNAINVHNSMQSLISPYITGNKWFLIDPTMSHLYLKWIDRKLPTFSSETDFDHESVKHKGVMRYDYGWSEWRFIYGNTPD